RRSRGGGRPRAHARRTPARLSCVSPQNALGEREVFGPGHLEVLPAALDKARLEAELLDGARLVGNRSGRLAQGLHQEARAEHLRRLGKPERAALASAYDTAVDGFL